MRSGLFRANTLSAKLALSLALFGMLYVVVLMALFVLFQLPQERKIINERIDRLVDTFVEPATQAVYNLDEETAHTVLAGFARHAYVEAAVIKSEDQTTLAQVTYARGGESHYSRLMGLLDSKKMTSYYRKLRDDRFREEIHGNLLVTVNQHRALQPVFEQMQSVLVANFLQYFVFVLIVYWIVYRIVAKRLARIHGVLDGISAKNPDNARVPVDQGHDEIDALASGINRFIESAEEYLKAKNDAEKGLRYLNQHLEEVIRSRTADLEIEKHNAEQARDEANRANQAKSVFLSNMSHELRTPLNSILGFTRRVIKKTGDKLDEREKDALERVLDNGQYLLNLVNDILDIAKIEADRMDLRYGDVSLNELIENCCSKLASLADGRALELHNRVDQEIQLKGDHQKLEQVFINLISNAIKYTPEGSVTVMLDSLDDSQVKIAVEDTGIGIKKEDFSKLFDAYNHIHSNLSAEVSVESTGLGLPLSKRIVELHGGLIQVSSEPGKGSRFVVCLPRKQNIELQEVS